MADSSEDVAFLQRHFTLHFSWCSKGLDFPLDGQLCQSGRGSSTEFNFLQEHIHHIYRLHKFYIASVHLAVFTGSNQASDQKTSAV
jgi:hypothetical protein